MHTGSSTEIVRAQQTDRQTDRDTHSQRAGRHQTPDVNSTRTKVEHVHVVQGPPAVPSCKHKHLIPMHIGTVSGTSRRPVTGAVHPSPGLGDEVIGEHVIEPHEPCASRRDVHLVLVQHGTVAVSRWGDSASLGELDLLPDVAVCIQCGTDEYGESYHIVSCRNDCYVYICTIQIIHSDTHHSYPNHTPRDRPVCVELPDSYIPQT